MIGPSRHLDGRAAGSAELPTEGGLNTYLNSELAKKPVECIEYIVVHELLHLAEPNHGERFVALMNRHLPRWAATQKRLNSAPLGHEDWDA